MPDVAGVAIDPTIVEERDGGVNVFDAAALYVVLENGEVWGRSTRGSEEWRQFGPVPNTPAAEGDVEGA